MNYKLLVLDVDGTLLDSSHHLTTDNLHSITKYQDLGGTVVIATGKLYHSIADLCRTLNLKTPQIIGNGYVLVAPDGKIVECMGYLSREQRDTAVSIFESAGLTYVFYSTQNIWYEEGRVEQSDLNKLIALGEVEPEGLKSSEVDDLQEVIKILSFCEDSEKEGEVEKAVETRDDIWTYRSSPQFIEIAMTGIDKGVGLKKLLQRLEIDASETAVIGDSENDLAMFEVAGLSVAMGQSPDHVKEKADVVTAVNDESGVAKFLQEYVFKS